MKLTLKDSTGKVILIWQKDTIYQEEIDRLCANTTGDDGLPPQEIILEEE